MARRTFFSFHYQRDIFRVNIVRKSNMIEGVSAAGWSDSSLWERAKLQSDAAVKRLIDTGLVNTSVTVVCIGALSARRRWIDYEIGQSIARGNKILGLRIHNIAAPPTNAVDIVGDIPTRLSGMGAKVINFTTAAALGQEIENLFAPRFGTYR